jgi:hypothetical protein
MARVAVVGELEPAGMPQHVGMHEEREFPRHARPGDHALISGYGTVGPQRTANAPSLLRTWLWYDPDVGPRCLPALRILLLGVLVAHRAGDDHVLSLFPVHRSRDLVFGGELERVNDPQHLVKVAASGHEAFLTRKWSRELD